MGMEKKYEKSKSKKKTRLKILLFYHGNLLFRWKPVFILASSNALIHFLLALLLNIAIVILLFVFFFVFLGQCSTFLHFTRYILLLNHVSIICDYEVFSLYTFDLFSCSFSPAHFGSGSFVEICFFNSYFYLLVFVCLSVSCSHRKTISIHFSIPIWKGGRIIVDRYRCCACTLIITWRTEF